MSDQPKFVIVARILRSQGRRGEVLCEILTNFPEKFAERRHLWLSVAGASEAREYEVQEHWFHKGQVVFKFAGVDSISEAEKLSGNFVQIPAESRAALDSGSIYVSDLLGCEITDLTHGHNAIGVIDDVQQRPGVAPLLIVRKDKQEYEIPFAQEFLVRFDADKKTLEMKLPSGMLEVNAPLSEEEKRRQRG